MLNIRLKFNQLLSRSPIKQRCLLCASHDSEDVGLCNACLNSLPWHNTPQCPQCGLSTQIVHATCSRCLSSPPDFDATHALFSYNFPIDRMLQHYKYKNSLHLADTFASLLHRKRFSKYSTQNHIDLIIPMPMHPARLKERGFNQALEIAKLLSKDMQIKLDYTSCQRSKYTPPQASLPLKERVKNIHGVFHCQQNLQGLKIAIVDDVMTTGASLNEVSKTLKQAGSDHVECWAIARTLPKPMN